MNVQCFKVEIVVVMSMYVALILCFFCACLICEMAKKSPFYIT